MDTWETAAACADEIVGRARDAPPRSAPHPGGGRCDRARGVRGGVRRAHRLARHAVDETGLGVVEHKIIKNAWASVLVYEDIRHAKTVGAIAHDEERGITRIAQPKGPVLATVPLNNPTSTTIFKALICLKTRNR